MTGIDKVIECGHVLVIERRHVWWQWSDRNVWVYNIMSLWCNCNIAGFSSYKLSEKGIQVF